MYLENYTLKYSRNIERIEVFRIKVHRAKIVKTKVLKKDNSRHPRSS